MRRRSSNRPRHCHLAPGKLWSGISSVCRQNCSWIFNAANFRHDGRNDYRLWKIVEPCSILHPAWGGGKGDKGGKTFVQTDTEQEQNERSNEHHTSMQPHGPPVLWKINGKAMDYPETNTRKFIMPSIYYGNFGCICVFHLAGNRSLASTDCKLISWENKIGEKKTHKTCPTVQIFLVRHTDHTVVFYLNFHKHAFTLVALIFRWNRTSPCTL